MQFEDIIDRLSQDKDIQQIFDLVEPLQLPDCWLCAGSIRNFIWNMLDNREPFDRETDVDIIFYDSSISYEKTVALENQLKEMAPQYKWELKNQAYMHIHNPNTPAYQDSCDAMSKFPEVCTAIGLKRDENGEFDLFAPYGIDDILHFIVSPTPYFLADQDRYRVYQERVAKKNWQDKWSRLKIII